MTKVTLYPENLRRQIQMLSLNQRKKIADEIAAEAQSNAPVLTGQYRDGIHVTVTGTTVKVVDTDDTALHKEYGTSDTPAHAVLTSAAMRRGRYQGMKPR